MVRYLSLTKYTTDALQRVRADGYATRPDAIKAFAQSVGVTVESVEFTLGGDWDFVAVMTAPSTDEIIAMSSFALASGVVERSQTFHLFSGEEVDAAIATATPEYTPPGSRDRERSAAGSGDEPQQQFAQHGKPGSGRRHHRGTAQDLDLSINRVAARIRHLVVLS